MLASLAVALSCGACANEAGKYADLGPRYEARAWLANNPNPYGLASNRFDSMAAARAFVDSLYALGADTVYVTNVDADSTRIREEGGPYADALLVALPPDGDARRRLFEVNAREARGEGMDPERDRGGRYLFFWWD